MNDIMQRLRDMESLGQLRDFVDGGLALVNILPGNRFWEGRIGGLRLRTDGVLEVTLRDAPAELRRRQGRANRSKVLIEPGRFQFLNFDDGARRDEPKTEYG